MEQGRIKKESTMGGKGQDAADLAAFGPVLPGAGADAAHRRPEHEHGGAKFVEGNAVASSFRLMHLTTHTDFETK